MHSENFQFSVFTNDELEACIFEETGYPPGNTFIKLEIFLPNERNSLYDGLIHVTNIREFIQELKDFNKKNISPSMDEKQAYSYLESGAGHLEHGKYLNDCSVCEESVYTEGAFISFPCLKYLKGDRSEKYDESYNGTACIHRSCVPQLISIIEQRVDELSSELMKEF